MKSLDTETCAKNLPAHFGHQFGPNLPDPFIVILVRLKSIEELLRDFCFGKAGGAHKPVPSLYWEDTRNDGNGDACRPDGLDPVNKTIGIVKHLRKDEVHARVHFLFKTFDLELKFFLGKKRMLRKPRNGYIKIISVAFVNISDEVNAVDKATFDGGPFVLACWRIAAKS
jgi:hypothetical protein